jgi:hypothetical protein
MLKVAEDPEEVGLTFKVVPFLNVPSPFPRNTAIV